MSDTQREEYGQRVLELAAKIEEKDAERNGIKAREATAGRRVLSADPHLEELARKKN